MDSEYQQNRQCTEWHRDLVDDFVKSTTTNISIRCKELKYILHQNEHLSANGDSIFHFDVDSFVHRVMVDIKPIIERVTLVQLNQCRTVPDSKDSYKKVARNRLNRNKPKFLGNLVFAPIIFDSLFHVELLPLIVCHVVTLPVACKLTKNEEFSVNLVDSDLTVLPFSFAVLL